MAVELKKLYEEIRYKYNVHLETESCFDKQISWLHILDNIEFAPFLHGDELIFNSSLNDASEKERQQYIDQLLLSKAGGLVVSLQPEHSFSNHLIQYCKEQNFPLFTTSWETPFINITRIFSEILIDTERTGMDLIAALKNAINHPNEHSSYLSHFTDNHFPLEDDYIISIIGYHQDANIYFHESMEQIEKIIKNTFNNCVQYKEGKMLVLLTRGYNVESILNSLSPLTDNFPDFYFSIGSTETQLSNIHKSYHTAKQTYYLSNRIIPKNPLCYKDIGVYQILVDMKNPETICPSFSRNILGKLIDYDRNNRTKYMDVLRDFFANDCSITRTSAATFYHPNTLKYKVKNIKEILGYDITSNENRVKIQLALYMLDLI